MHFTRTAEKCTSTKYREFVFMKNELFLGEFRVKCVDTLSFLPNRNLVSATFKLNFTLICIKMIALSNGLNNFKFTYR